jgi:hypothetical protein
LSTQYNTGTSQYSLAIIIQGANGGTHANIRHHVKNQLVKTVGKVGFEARGTGTAQTQEIIHLTQSKLWEACANATLVQTPVQAATTPTATAATCAAAQPTAAPPQQHHHEQRKRWVPPPPHRGTETEHKKQKILNDDGPHLNDNSGLQPHQGPPQREERYEGAPSPRGKAGADNTHWQ